MAFFWQPTFYFEGYSVTLQSASLYSCLPWVASAGMLYLSYSILCVPLCRAASSSLPPQQEQLQLHLRSPGVKGL